MKSQEIKQKRRLRRKFHIRKRINGTAEKPRLTVTKSHKHFYAQIIDDENSATLVAASTLDKDVKNLINPDNKKMDYSKFVGEAIAKKAIEKGIKNVAFDRNGYLYHGRIKAFADSARKSGLEF